MDFIVMALEIKLEILIVIKLKLSEFDGGGEEKKRNFETFS